MRSLLIALACLSPFSHFARPLAAEQTAPSPTVQEIVQAKDFWATSGRLDSRKWTDQELETLRQLASTGPDGAIRLRASKILVDAAGHARFNVGKNDKQIALAAFQHLEAHLKDASVQKLMTRGFNHYSVSKTDNPERTWFLIETVGQGPSGGLNLAWDSDSQQIGETVAWGSVK